MIKSSLDGVNNSYDDVRNINDDGTFDDRISIKIIRK